LRDPISQTPEKKNVGRGGKKVVSSIGAFFTKKGKDGQERESLDTKSDEGGCPGGKKDATNANGIRYQGPARHAPMNAGSTNAGGKWNGGKGSQYKHLVRIDIGETARESQHEGNQSRGALGVTSWKA